MFEDKIEDGKQPSELGLELLFLPLSFELGGAQLGIRVRARDATETEGVPHMGREKKTKRKRKKSVFTDLVLQFGAAALTLGEV